ncbi:RNA polymerase sigma factor [Glaciibacter flavus]|uniref:RNA polymerase sigma factor n=1 Tax=Orlajensenia flava TaxID=2565934 RepID=UPI003AFFD9A7
MTDAASASAAAASVVRRSAARLIALLAAPTRDIPLAEDVLGDAVERALLRWPVDGVPDNPEAWLLTVARNRQRDLLGGAARTRSAPLDEESVMHTIDDALEGLDAIPDKRLELLYVCAHPAIDPGIRTPLMLQTVLGVDAAVIARAFAVPESAMAQRLVRAKRRIKLAGIPFVVPTKRDLAGRTSAVLEAVYGAYALDSTESGELAFEALHLAMTTATLLPDDAEAAGLAALIALSLARVDARVVSGEYVPLDGQDTALWSRPLIETGERMLTHAFALGRPGRFQLEAAIQSAHDSRIDGGVVDVRALVDLHAALVAVQPTLGSRVAHAAAVGRADGASAGLDVLEAMAPAAERFQPYWATKAHLLEAIGAPESSAAYARAIELCDDPPARRHLERRRAALETAGPD